MCNEFLLSPKSARAVRAIKMDDKFTLDVSALAPGTFVDFTSPAIAALKALGLSYTVYVSLVQTGVIAVSDIGFEFRLMDEKRMGFLGAELSSQNANACAINACDVGVCVGALEDLTVRVSNETLAAFPANSRVTFKILRKFSGDPKYICAREAAAQTAECAKDMNEDCGSCATKPGASAGLQPVG